VFFGVKAKHNIANLLDNFQSFQNKVYHATDQRRHL
jgi:hypothetical protein